MCCALCDVADDRLHEQEKKTQEKEEGKPTEIEKSQKRGKKITN